MATFFMYKKIAYSAIAAVLVCAAFSNMVLAQTSTDSTAPAVRSVRLHNYNSWGMGNDLSAQGLQASLVNLAKRNNISFGELREKWNSTPGWSGLSSVSIKALNPAAKTYRYFAMACKTAWDTDWNGGPKDRVLMNTPLTKAEIDANDWWLRDGNGNIVKESEDQWYLDVGKPGFKERYLQACLERTSGQRFNGFVFDYWLPTLKRWVDLQDLPRPVDYPTNDDWFSKAWKPFVDYVVNGLHQAGYRVIGNCIGEHGTTVSYEVYDRSKADGVIYEQGAVGWWGNGDGWLPSSDVAKRINSISGDPLEVWMSDEGLRPEFADYDQKQNVSLAMYYISIPASQSNRSYHHAYDGSCYWQPLWDFYIGVPAETRVKMSGRYFWSRKYTYGLVLLNYEDGVSISYSLNRRYVDSHGRIYTKRAVLPPHTALILARR